jgi:hypothetical protein
VAVRRREPGRSRRARRRCGRELAVPAAYAGGGGGLVEAVLRPENDRPVAQHSLPKNEKYGEKRATRERRGSRSLDRWAGVSNWRVLEVGLGRRWDRASGGGEAARGSADAGGAASRGGRYRRHMTEIVASGTTQILLATGAGAFAIVVGGVGIWFTLDQEDRGKLGVLLRHPVRTIFSEDQPDEDDLY